MLPWPGAAPPRPDTLVTLTDKDVWWIIFDAGFNLKTARKRLERGNQSSRPACDISGQMFLGLNPPGSDGGGEGWWVGGSMTKGWKNGLEGRSSFRSLSWFSEGEEKGSIHVREAERSGPKPAGSRVCHWGFMWFLLLHHPDTKHFSHLILQQRRLCCPLASALMYYRTISPCSTSNLNKTSNPSRVPVVSKHAREEERHLWFGRRANTPENKCHACISLI